MIMFVKKLYIASALSLATAVCCSKGISENLCDAKSDDPLCSPAYYVSYTMQIIASCQPGVLDNRHDGALQIHVSVQDPDKNNVLLAKPGGTPPRVYLQTDGGEVQVDPSDVVTQPDQTGLNVIVRTGLGVGRLKVRVALSDSPALQSNGTADCAMTRSPFFAAATEIPATVNPRGNIQITGFAGVQIGTVQGQTGRLILVEQYVEFPSTPRRLAELYGTISGTIARDTMSTAWANTGRMLPPGSGVDLIAATRDSLLSYDIYTGGPNKNLSLLRLDSANYMLDVNLTSATPAIRTDRTAMAAATDAQLLLLGNAGQVSWFHVTPGPGPEITQSPSDNAPVTGAPVLAARAERVSVPKVAYGAYYGVAWGTDGKATLLRSDMQTTNLTPVALDDQAQQSFIAILNPEEAVLAAALADFNGDGLEDLLVATSVNRFLWAPQQLDNHFGTFRELNVKPPGVVTSLSAGYANADGLIDLAAIADQKAYVYLGTAM